jgi:hypothetical protein
MASQTKPGPSRLPGAAGPAAPLLPAAAPQGYLPPGLGDRLWFVDHLRLVLICGVVVAHVASLYAGRKGEACVPCSHLTQTTNSSGVLATWVIRSEESEPVKKVTGPRVLIVLEGQLFVLFSRI